MTDTQISTLLTAMKHMIQASEERLEKRISTSDKLVEALDRKLSSRIDTLEERFGTLEENLTERFSNLAQEMMKYTDGGSSYCYKRFEDHEERIGELEKLTV